jgi:hypothetical protein
MSRPGRVRPGGAGAASAGLTPKSLRHGPVRQRGAFLAAVVHPLPEHPSIPPRKPTRAAPPRRPRRTLGPPAPSPEDAR